MRKGKGRRRSIIVKLTGDGSKLIQGNEILEPEWLPILKRRVPIQSQRKLTEFVEIRIQLFVRNHDTLLVLCRLGRNSRRRKRGIRRWTKINCRLRFRRERLDLRRTVAGYSQRRLSQVRSLRKEVQIMELITGLGLATGVPIGSGDGGSGVVGV